MARRARASRSRNDTTPSAGPSPHIRRTLPFFDVLDEDQLEKLDAQVDWLLDCLLYTSPSPRDRG